jgi:hypothetical protein
VWFTQVEFKKISYIWILLKVFSEFWFIQGLLRGRRGCDRMVVGFTTKPSTCHKSLTIFISNNVVTSTPHHEWGLNSQL